MHAPNLGNLKQLVLMGESAGAYGVGFNCDLVADRFHEEMPDLDVRCVADAGDFYPPYMSISEDCDVLTAMSQVASFFHSAGDTSCFSGTWGTDNTELECLTFMTSYPEITTPFMVVNHFVDTTVHGWCAPGLNGHPEFWAAWEEEVKAMALRYVEDKPGIELFLNTYTPIEYPRMKKCHVESPTKMRQPSMMIDQATGSSSPTAASMSL